MEVAKQAMDLNTGSLDQRIVYEACRTGVVTNRLPQLRARYQRKRDVMERALQTAFGGSVSWPEPRGGFFLWVTLPQGADADALLPRALEEKVLYVAGSAFFVADSEPNTLRLSFSAPSEERIEEGVRRLARAFRDVTVAAPARTR
jgi:2-aminoadipate transaminase